MLNLVEFSMYPALNREKREPDKHKWLNACERHCFYLKEENDKVEECEREVGSHDVPASSSAGVGSGHRSC